MSAPAITYVTGDATDPQGPGLKLLIHICNDEGRWGMGFVVPLGNRWPAARDAYLRVAHSHEGKLPLGLVIPALVAPDLVVLNLVAQEGLRRRDGHGRPPIRYESLRECLHKVADRYADREATVHGPRLGAGLAGGNWREIEDILLEELVEKGFPVTIYDLPASAGATR